ncbi:MAG TPA: efflux RND transporter permease subunit [Thermoanaerobaculia bacterium]|nr:efflux RND transporter permease subunit [Thermoanaerobaculia bacterium]
MSRHEQGLAGRVAATFIDSKLTPLIIVASILIGAGAVALLPREEEPQIVVPMVDVFVEMPGATPEEIAARVTRPMEKLLWEIPGVEYLYSTSSPGMSMVIIRFKVGTNEEDAVVRLKTKLDANADAIPPGATPPLVKPRSIDDVPVVALTLASARYDHFALRRLAVHVQNEIKQAPDVSEVTVIGGTRRQLRVTIDPARLAAHGLSPAAVAGALARSNRETEAGSFSIADTEVLVQTGGFIRTAGDAGEIVVGGTAGPIYLRDVATITDGPEEPADYVFSGTGDTIVPAVTIAVAKRKATNATDLAHAVIERVESMKGSVIPEDVTVTVTRNYGETAAEKSNELLFHMLLAVMSVAILIAVTLGWRESVVVAIAIPVTLALTLSVFYVLGYTLNRVTLFALIFSIGILVDDAIVVVENIVRHYRLPENRRRPLRTVAIEAVAEVGNPTILATFTVIAAILPMGFVSGLMGPYMRPIPVGATAAMLFSLVVAFIVTPWAAVRLLRRHDDAAHGGEGWSTRLYRRLMGRVIDDPRVRRRFLIAVAAMLVAAVSLFAVKLVRVKMLPFDNKSEFQIIVDMPEGTTLERTAGVAREIGAALRNVPEVANWQMYAGTSSPYNFNGLVRHYFLRRGPNVADIQVNLRPKGDRDAQSHAIARRVRDEIAPIGARYGARLKVAEVPPGPPVLQTLVAEVYGPDYDRQIAVARSIQQIFESTPGVVDVDTYIEDEQRQIRFEVDRPKAALSGISLEQIDTTLRLALDGIPVGLLHQPAEEEAVPIVVDVPRPLRSSVEQLQSIHLSGSFGQLVPLGEVVRIEETTAARSIYHKNLMPVVYVTGDVAGAEESPVYAILKLNRAIDALQLPEGYSLQRWVAQQPGSTERLAMKWDGEWHITYEVFRDLGIAFAAVLILIYILVVGWFQSFKTPLTIMAAIPFSLVGIIPAHAAMGAFFTATSMIGFIAGAGIVVRNSIILVDFIELRLRQGMPLAEAVVDAGAVRFRPMMLTAAAVVVGAGVILFDPIFQGLAISLMAGEVASLLLSRATVPVLYFLAGRKRPQEQPPREVAPAEEIADPVMV